MTVLRRRWREWAWAGVVVALVLALSYLPAVFVLALLPPLDRAFTNYHRQATGGAS